MAVDLLEVLDKLLRPGGAAAGAPDVVTLLGSALGLGFLSGFRLYATVFALGMAIRFQWFSLHQTMSSLSVLADTRVLAVAGAICLVEFLADKIPWLDSAWDSIHTFIRPAAAVVLASATLGSIDPVMKTIIALICGGVALTAHSTKAATRLAVNHSPEPVSNIVVSLAEDLAAPAGLWFVMAHPGIFLAILAVFLGAFGYFAPKILRQIRLELAALRSLLGRLVGVGPTIQATLPKAALTDPRARQLWEFLHTSVDELPGEFARKSGLPVGVRAAATESLPGLNRSIGYLCFRDQKFTFITRRWFKIIAHTIPYSEMKSVSLRSGLFVNQLVVKDQRGNRIVFDVFKVAPNPATQPLVAPAAS